MVLRHASPVYLELSIRPGVLGEFFRLRIAFAQGFRPRRCHFGPLLGRNGRDHHGEEQRSPYKKSQGCEHAQPPQVRPNCRWSTPLAKKQLQSLGCYLRSKIVYARFIRKKGFYFQQ
jgi:hypothetical protein